MDDGVKAGCVDMCKEIHQTTRKLSEKYLDVLQRHNYVTPTSYLELISTYKTLLAKKRRFVHNGPFTVTCTCTYTYDIIGGYF